VNLKNKKVTEKTKCCDFIWFCGILNEYLTQSSIEDIKFQIRTGLKQAFVTVCSLTCFGNLINTLKNISSLCVHVGVLALTSAMNGAKLCSTI
jgi:hypothetical protein